MSMVSITFDERLTNRLRIMLDSSNEDGLIIKHMVGTVGSLKIEIRANEHPPPHFHVRYNGEDASFTLNDCKLLRCSRGLVGREKIIRMWWKEHRRELAICWNETRPADCPVGPVIVPD